MNLVPFPQPEQQSLQELLDLAVDNVFADYEESGVVRSRAIAVLDNKTRKRTRKKTCKSIDLESDDRVERLEAVADQGLSAINATGAKRGAVVVHVLQQGQELVFIFVVSGDAKAVCALGLNRQTGKCVRDIALVSEMKKLFEGEIDYDFLEPSDWLGPTCTVEIQPTAEILKFQPRPKPGV